jgi:hypothetical protein
MVAFQPNAPAGFYLDQGCDHIWHPSNLTLYFFVRYRHATSEVERQRRAYELQIDEIRQLLNQQIEIYQRLMSHTRESFYERVEASIYQHRFSMSRRA